jgi:hypothetical protein
MIKAILRVSLFLVVSILLFVAVKNKQNINPPPESKKYILQKIDDDGVAWYVYMTWPDYQKWAGKKLRLK